MIDLQRFCATHESYRTHLRQPFRHGAWVYATNGHICVRVPFQLAPDVPLGDVTKIPKNLEELFAMWAGEPTCTLPELEPLMQCHACKGGGTHMAIKCGDCVDGTFFRGQHSYECKNCCDSPVAEGWLTSPDGTVVKTCACCYGRGFAEHTQKIGDNTFELGYLHWLAALPGPKILPHAVNEPISARFDDGGEALLMPWRS